MPLVVDLHSHTTCSDGRVPPRELVRLAKAQGVQVLAVTDHDTVEALPDALEEGRLQGVRIVPGIEMSSRFEGHDVHVLGYGIDHRAPGLLRRLGELQESRRVRVGKICEKLKALGVPLEPADVLAEAGGKSVGRKHVARALLQKGLVRSLDDAFNRFLGQGSPANVPANDWTPAEAARFILEFGGQPSLAHPGFLEDPALAERILDSAPIRAIEVFHRYRSSTRHLRFLDLARRRQLQITGGSDFHGDEHPNNGSLGSFRCPPGDWKEFEYRMSGL
ncbi:MAG TPA: PHP domain-containing protein [Planctomycetota bacterium]|nr:PHP domain-containing protein [Planctomycetota bacterium]